MNSKQVQIVMGLILAFGNHMNGGMQIKYWMFFNRISQLR